MSTITNSNVRAYNKEEGSFNPYRNLSSYGKSVGHKLPVKVSKHKAIVSKRELHFLRTGLLVTTLSLLFCLYAIFQMTKVADTQYRERMMLKNSKTAQKMELQLSNVSGDMVTFTSDNHTFITKVHSDIVNYLTLGDSYEVIYDNGELTTVTKINK